MFKVSNGFNRGGLESIPRRWQFSVNFLNTLDFHLANVPGCASLMALVGSALVLIWNAAFSLAVSAASTLGIEPLLVFLLLPVKLSIELLRFLAMAGRAAGAASERLRVAKSRKRSNSLAAWDSNCAVDSVQYCSDRIR